jgi:hypothetical protein
MTSGSIGKVQCAKVKAMVRGHLPRAAWTEISSIATAFSVERLIDSRESTAGQLHRALCKLPLAVDLPGNVPRTR